MIDDSDDDGYNEIFDGESDWNPSSGRSVGTSSESKGPKVFSHSRRSSVDKINYKKPRKVLGYRGNPEFSPYGLIKMIITTFVIWVMVIIFLPPIMNGEIKLPSWLMDYDAERAKTRKAAPPEKEEGIPRTCPGSGRTAGAMLDDGLYYLDKSRINDAAACFRDSCNQGNPRACNKFADLLTEKNHALPLRALEHGCSLNDGMSCHGKARYLIRFFPEDAEKQQEAMNLMIRSCDYGYMGGCGYRARKELEEGRERVAYRTANKACRAEDAMSCAIAVIMSIQRQAPMLTSEERLLYLKQGCDEMNLSEACYYYALELPDDLRAEKSLALDRSCEIDPAKKRCDIAARFRESGVFRKAPGSSEPVSSGSQPR